MEREARVVLSRAGLGLSPRGKMGTAGGLQVYLHLEDEQRVLRCGGIGNWSS